MRVFVTGGSGFIGSHTIEVLEHRGHQVLNYDIKPPVLPQQSPFWREGDVRNAEAVLAVMREFEPDAVIHLAAKADIYADGWEDFDSIHLGTASLMQAAEAYGRLESLVNISTQLVVGPTHKPKSLLDYRPYTPYGEAKAFAEGLLLQWRSPIHWLNVRPANIWGPRHPTFAEAIWRYIAKRYYLHPATGEPVLRSYGYVANTAEQIVGLLEAPRSITYRQTYYAADEVMDSALWVDAFSHALTGSRARRIPVPALRALGVAGDLLASAGRRSPLDSGRVMRMTESYPVPLEPTFELVGAPTHSFETGVAASVGWLRTLGGAYVRQAQR